MGTMLLVIISAVLVNNFVLAKFLGICPFLGVSRKIETAIGMSLAVVFVMSVAGPVTYFVQMILVRLGIAYLQTIAFILVIAMLVQLVETVLQKLSPALYRALGIYLPLITTNCAVLGVAVLNVQKDYDLITTLLNSMGSAIGFGLALVLFAGIRERLETADAPQSFKGTALALITAGLFSLAFMGFAGLVR